MAGTVNKYLQRLPFLICSPFLGSSCSASGSLCITNSLYKQFSDLDSNISDKFKSGPIWSHLSSQWGHTCSGGGSPYPTRTPPTWSYTPTPFPPSLCWFASWAPWSTPTLSSTFRYFIKGYWQQFHNDIIRMQKKQCQISILNHFASL